jgi:hypothetical protein
MTPAVMKFIRDKVIAVRGFTPDDEVLSAWYHELGNYKISVLRRGFIEANELKSARNDSFPVSPVEVHRAVRVVMEQVSEVQDPPHNESCIYGCHGGWATMWDPDGYRYAVVCDCSAGEWWRRRGRGKNHISQYRAWGYDFRPPPVFQANEAAPRPLTSSESASLAADHMPEWAK